VVKDIYYHNKMIARGSRVGGLYKLDVTRGDHQALACTIISMEELWHKSYGHLNHNDLMMLQKKERVEVLPMFMSEHLECEGCELGKKYREVFPMHINKRKREKFQVVHTHVCGLMKTRSLGGAYYFLIFVDDRTRYTWVNFMRNKSDVFECFKEFKNMVKNET
jgi:hypothetical protein